MSRAERVPFFIEHGLPYRLEAVEFDPSEPKGVMVTAYGVPRGTDNDKSYKPDRFAPYIAEASFITTAHSPEGMGNSGGDTKELTLARRTREIVSVAEHMAQRYPNLQLSLYGSSMGAHLVIRAMQELKQRGIKVDNLILVSPAAYPDISENATFGDAFRTAITGAHDSDIGDFGVFELLEEFEGRVVLTWVEGDPVDKGGPLFPNIIEWFNQTIARRQTVGKGDLVINVPGVEHSFRIEGKGIEDDPESLKIYQDFCQQVGRFITQL